jgi:2,4-dienoyl-CoA reductase-like NADH-dependent reductase (Old Yellow Enzyme family)
MSTGFPRIAALRGASGLRARLAELGLDLPCDDGIAPPDRSPLATPLRLPASDGAAEVRGGPILANRFAIQPMEGWDGTRDGRPSELTVRRWRRFGSSGAAWIWGGEAIAVRADARANPRQLLLDESTAGAIGGLRRELVAAARGVGSEPLIGLQLTHSGRWSRPDPERRAPRIAFHHPQLDGRVGVACDADAAVLSDGEVDEIVACFARAARLAREEGFAFVDVKHCHGYLLHEFLAARSRIGRWGGESLTARTRLLRTLVAAVRESAPGLAIGVRLSVFDALPHRPEETDAQGRAGVGVPEACELPYRHGFGLDESSPQSIDLGEPIALARELVALGVRWLNVTAGSPYYVPHVQRPAAFPASDGYAPPEDPLVGVARLLGAARAVKAAVPELAVLSSGWSYLQDFLPHVAQACVRAGWFDAIGLGRMVLSYPELPGDVLAGRPLDRRRLCRTFSDCTTAPRGGLVSGCYPLDPFYRERPERAELERRKRAPAVPVGGTDDGA